MMSKKMLFAPKAASWRDRWKRPASPGFRKGLFSPDLLAGREKRGGLAVAGGDPGTVKKSTGARTKAALPGAALPTMVPIMSGPCEVCLSGDDHVQKQGFNEKGFKTIV